MTAAAAKTLSLALQGGGSHGAFTWGVLDEILGDERLLIEAVSGTSAGSMNAVIATYGLEQGGRPKARELLEAFWMNVARIGAFSPIQPTFWERMLGQGVLDYSPLYLGMDLMSRVFSPYQFNPLGIHPLRQVLLDIVDFDQLKSCNKIKLYLSATNVRTGGLKVFQNDDVTVDVLLASACLPHLFRAVEIKGEYYWDGGYMGNPTLYPLIHHCQSQDIVIVQINPITREEVPKTPNAIQDRVNEISFNSALLHELNGLLLVNKLVQAHHLDNSPFGLRHLHLHMIQDEALMRELSYASKLSADEPFLLSLRDAGRAAARAWLDKHYDIIGQNSSFDYVKLFA